MMLMVVTVMLELVRMWILFVDRFDDGCIGGNDDDDGHVGAIKKDYVC